MKMAIKTNIFFFFGIITLIFFEIANVYFIMPFPGSQQINSIQLAYFLYHWRWVFRIVLGLIALLGIPSVFASPRKLIWPLLTIVLWIAVTWLFNFKMTAEKMFREPNQLIMKMANENTVDTNRIVLGIEINGEAAAFPLQFVAYHHRVLYQLGGKNIWATYCSVCRTGRVFEPVVEGKQEQFRLVGMDHFNAMFEDKTTGSWWRQVNGECIAGKNKGNFLPEIKFAQMSLGQWIKLHPETKIMQPDPVFMDEYEKLQLYESGEMQGSLERRDTASWEDKSWVVGILVNGTAKAYDWNELVKQRYIRDSLFLTPLVVCIGNDNSSFSAFSIPFGASVSMKKDSLIINGIAFNLEGKSHSDTLSRLPHYQEYWHSWKTFHPKTKIYKNEN